MATFSPFAAYYRITWNLTTPNNYTGSNSTGGGINPFNSRQYHSMIATTGNVDVSGGYGGSTGDELLLNGYIIGPFTNGDTVPTIVQRFNTMSNWTNIMASTDINPKYITLSCAYPSVQTAITLANYVGTPLASLGFTAGSFTYPNPIYGGTFTAPTNNQNIVVNGTTITFTTAGGLSLSGVCSTINSVTGVTDVVATPAAGNVQLNSASNSPIYILSGTATSGLGFTNGTAYAGAMTYTDAVEDEQGFLRWKYVASGIESLVTPNYYAGVSYSNTTVQSTNGVNPPAQFSWTLGVDHIDALTTVTLTGEPEGAGVQLSGPACVKRLISRALTNSYTENCNVYNPNIAIAGSSVIAFNTSQMVTQSITAGALDVTGNINLIEQNLTVTQIYNV